MLTNVFANYMSSSFLLRIYCDNCDCLSTWNASRFILCLLCLFILSVLLWCCCCCWCRLWTPKENLQITKLHFSSSWWHPLGKFHINIYFIQKYKLNFGIEGHDAKIQEKISQSWKMCRIHFNNFRCNFVHNVFR